MKIAIHHRKNSFSEEWINYCKINDIKFKIVNAYSNDILDEIKGYDYFLWHWIHTDYKASIFARQLTQVLETKGVKVFPNLNTCWHFDDKIGQKYLFESLELPHIKSYIFYDKMEAIEWANNTTFPKVFKLRGGASSNNVKLINSKNKARKNINLAFKNGFKLIDNSEYIKAKLYNLKKEKSILNYLKVIKGIYKYFIPNRENDLLPVQKGYVYFQDFVEGNEFDTRVTIIGDRCFAFRRFNRKGDFRASGSGMIDFSPEFVDLEAIKLAFKISEKLGAQSIAYDFIYKNKSLTIVEISYCFVALECPGYWDEKLQWHDAKFKPQHWMIEDLINS